MARLRSRLLLGMLAIVATALFANIGEAADGAKPQIVILKLDDVLASSPAAPRWQRVTDYLLANKLHASYGIICSSLEKDNLAYFKWIKDLQEQGAIEFWLHGYYNRKAEDKTGEFDQGTAEEQAAVLEKSQRLAKEKLGFSLPAFGPHWSGTTDATDEALEKVPDVKIWLYGPKKPRHFSRLSLERVMALEDPTFVPDAAKFRSTYDRLAAKRDVLVLQGHPAAWDDQRWEGFVSIVEFLRAQKCTFMTPSEYARQLSSSEK